MTKKIFQSILLVAGAVLLASLLIIMGFLYSYFGGVEENQLRDELSLASAAVESSGTDYLSQLTAERCRLTWIAADGSVLYDTRTDAESLENHAARAEVSQALSTGTGESTRYSSTLMEKTMYYAQRLTDGTVLRISISRATVGMIAVGMLQPLLLVLIAALILSGMLARRLSRRIVDPLNSLDLEHPLDNDAYEELSPLLKRIHHQHVEIRTQLRELREKTDEFTQITGSMREGLVLLDEHQRRGTGALRRGRAVHRSGLSHHRAQPRDQCRHSGRRRRRAQRGARRARGAHLSVRHQPHRVRRETDRHSHPRL